MTQAGTSFYSRQTYFPYGAPRTMEGSALPTDNTFTGQKSDDSTELMFYNARYYDTTLGRFTQPDTIVPNPLNPQSLNRFAYVLNNPLKYTDPTGHYECWDEDCDGGPSGGGGSNGGGSSGNVNPCNADPTAEGCPGAQEAVPPAETQEEDQDSEEEEDGTQETATPGSTPNLLVTTGTSQGPNQGQTPTASATDLWFRVDGYGSTVCVWTWYCRSWGWDVVTDMNTGQKALFAYDGPGDSKFLCAFVCLSSGLHEGVGVAHDKIDIVDAYSGWFGNVAVDSPGKFGIQASFSTDGNVRVSSISYGLSTGLPAFSMIATYATFQGYLP